MRGPVDAEAGAVRRSALLDVEDVAPLRSVLEAARNGLQVGPVEIAFLVVLRRELERPDAATLPLPKVEEIYGRVSAAAGAPVATTRRRSRVDSLLGQRLLLESRPARHDREALLTLSPVGREIARAYDVGAGGLERERLTSVMEELKNRLRVMLDEAVLPDVDWAARVAAPLRGAVLALADDVARRQVTLDRLHEVVVTSVVERLSGGWKDALAECQAILGRATDVARELCRALLTDAEQALDLIDRIDGLALERDEGLLGEVDQLRNEVERLRHWADDRLTRWTEHHRRVIGYIDTLVRLDPDRVVAGRLRTLVPLLGRSMAETGRTPYSLDVVAQQQFEALRPQASPEMRAEVAIEPNDMTVAFEGDRLDHAREGLRGRAERSIALRGRVTLHELLEGLDGIAERDHNELCDWAVGYLARLGDFIDDERVDWTPVSDVLVAVQPLIVVGRDRGR